MGYYDFPNTRMYDGDLGYLIKMYKELKNLYQSNNEYLEAIYKDIENVTKEQLVTWLDDGTLENVINNSLFISKISRYLTVAEMAADSTLEVNNVCQTIGYYSPNDVGDCLYLITNNSDSPNIKLDNGLYAMPIMNQINVRKLGAHANNTDDDLEYFNLAINLANNGQIIEIPVGEYLIKGELVVSKPITLHGATTQNDTFNDIPLKGSVLNFFANQAQDNAINITVNGVILEGLNIVNASDNSQFIGNGVRISTYIGDLTWNITIQNCQIINFISHGIYATNLLLSQFKNIYIYDCANGFEIDGTTSTSILIERVWIRRTTGIGFKFTVLTYSTLLNCACDISQYAYYLLNCYSVSLEGCGAEFSKSNPYEFNGSSGIVLISPRTYGCPSESSGTSFGRCTNNADVTIIGATESNVQNSPTYSISCDASSNCIAIGNGLTLPIYSGNQNGNIRDMFMPFPKTSFNGVGNFVSIQSSNGYTLPGDRTQTYFYCVYSTNLYCNITTGGTQIVPSGNAYGYAIRIK